jgi:hypothetical protein
MKKSPSFGQFSLSTSAGSRKWRFCYEKDEGMAGSPDRYPQKVGLFHKVINNFWKKASNGANQSFLRCMAGQVVFRENRRWAESTKRIG